MTVRKSEFLKTQPQENIARLEALSSQGHTLLGVTKTAAGRQVAHLVNANGTCWGTYLPR